MKKDLGLFWLGISVQYAAYYFQQSGVLNDLSNWGIIAAVGLPMIFGVWALVLSREWTAIALWIIVIQNSGSQIIHVLSVMFWFALLPSEWPYYVPAVFPPTLLMPVVLYLSLRDGK